MDKDLENHGLNIIDIEKVYHTKNGDVHALSKTNLHVHRKEFVALLGTSGCGKSTLLRMIGGLTERTSGEIIYDNKVLNKPSADVGMVFQKYTLFPWLSVEQNIAFGLKQKKEKSKEQINEIVSQYVDLVGLRGFEKLYPKSLSGGMQQRVAIARALANDPSILLLDEPFGALDTTTREIMQELLLDVWQKSPKTIVMVTHDVEEAVFLADRVVVMSARPGRVREIIDIDIDRPRDYRIKSSQKFVEYKMRAFELIREESMKLMKEGL